MSLTPQHQDQPVLTNYAPRGRAFVLPKTRISIQGTLILCCALLWAIPAGAQTPPAMQQITPKASSEPLLNPGMGLYLFGTLNEKDLAPNLWPTQVINIGYFRDDWAKVQPDGPGSGHFAAYFQPIFDLWVKNLHKRVAFRFMSQNMHSESRYTTPKWVFDVGVPSETFKGIYVPQQTDPVFWDDHYLKIQEQFIADLGKYLDGRPGLEFIDIGGIGEWGEMHLARWTPAQLADSGYTPEKYVMAYRRLIDAYARAFPHTRVFLNVGDWVTINDYAAIHGVNFRQDGLTPTGASYQVGPRYYREYAKRGIVCNYELYAGYDEMKQKGWGIQATFDKGLEDPISYLHVNLMGFGEMAKAPAEVRDAVTNAAQRIGFRFAPTLIRCSWTIRVSPKRAARVLIESHWKNSGVAPCYDSYALRWDLVDSTGKTVLQKLSFPTVPTTRWGPGEEIAQSDLLSIPVGVPTGQYHLRVAMVKPEEPDLRIKLALANADADGRYEVASLSAVATADTTETVLHEEFEKGIVGWQPIQGIAASRDGAGHTGACLRLAGKPQEDAWSYAAFALPKPLTPAARYRLSGWMKVDALTPGAAPPYLKIGLNDASRKWITNVETNHYDVARLGTWQELMAWVETTPETATGVIAVEKGSLEARPTISLRLDDVGLELLEAP